MAQSAFLHHVYFWMREPGNSEHATLLAEGCRRHLSDIPGVLRLAVGFPAGTPREVVDSSYGVALVVEFGNSADHDIYQEHPDHLRFIAECSRFWSRVQIYDMLVQPA